MSNKENISDKELEKQAPLLFGLEKKDCEAPESYFEHLSNDIISKLEAPIHQLPKSVLQNHVWKIAAGIALLLGSYFLLNPSSQGPMNGLIVDTVQVDLEQDMDYLLEIEDDIIYSVLAEQLPVELEEELDPRIEYLMEEEIELEEIINL